MMKAFFIALAAWLALIAPADAQTGSSKNTTQLIIEVGQEFPDNNLGLITPFNARQFQLDLLASTPNFSTAGTFTAAQAFNGGATAVTRSPGDNTTNVATTAFVATAAADILTTANTWTQPQAFNGGITCTFSSSPLAQCLNTFQSSAGGAITGATNLNILVIQDALTCSGGGCSTAFVDGWSFIYNVQGGSGGRQGMQITMSVPSGSTWSPSPNPFITTLVPILNVDIPVSGGRMFAFNPVLNIEAGGTGVVEASIDEHDLVLSAATMYGSALKLVAGGTTHASTAETLLSFSAAGGSQGIHNLMLVGGFAGSASPFDGTTGTPNANGGCILCLIGNPGFEFGIDLASANPQGSDLSGGFSFRSGVSTFGTTFSVDWHGNVIASTLNLGSNSGAILGAMGLFGSSSGKITLNPQAASGTYNWNWPITAGTANFLLTSQGGGATAMTWTSPTVTVNTVACTLGGSCTISAASSLVVGSSTITGSCTSGFNLYNNGGTLGCQANGSGGGLTVGTTSIASGTTQQLLYDNGGTLGEVAKGNNCVYGTNGTGVPSCVTTLPFTVSLATGGTNANLTASNGGIVYSTASAFAVLAGTVTAGQCLLSGSSAAPTWGSCASATVSSLSNYAGDTTLTLSGSTGAITIKCTLASASQVGCVEGDGATLNISGGGIVSVNLANAFSWTADHSFSGTTNPTMGAGQLFVYGAQSTNPTLSANGEGAIWLCGTSGTANGLCLQGKGSANDLTLFNAGGSIICQIPTGTIVFNCNGQIATGSTIAATTGGAGAITSAGGIFAANNIVANGNGQVMFVGGSNAGSFNDFTLVNSGTVATAGTEVLVQLSLTQVANTTLNMAVIGGATPFATVEAGSNLTNGLSFITDAGPLVFNAKTTLTFESNGSGVCNYSVTTASVFTCATPFTLSNAAIKMTALPASAGGGGLFVCRDSTGALYAKSTCP